MGYYIKKIINRMYDALVPSHRSENALLKIKEIIAKSDPIVITFVCTGNICRSAFSHYHLLAQDHSDIKKITVLSSGLQTSKGKPADQTAMKISEEFAVNLDSHQTTPSSLELIEKSDLLFVMEASHLLNIISKYPSSRKKVFLLSTLNRKSLNSWTIDDPYLREDSFFKNTFSILTACNLSLLNLLKISKNEA